MPRGIYPRTEEHKQKISLALKGRVISEEWRAKISQTNKDNGIIPPSRKGIKLSDEEKKKMSEVRKGEKNHFFGKTHTNESKLKISEAGKGRLISKESIIKRRESLKKYYEEHPEARLKVSKQRERENCHFWKGGISFELYGEGFTKELKHTIRMRDKFVCQVCGKNGWIIHHIDYDKQNHEWGNLATVCNSCHSKTNYNREYWINFFAEIHTGIDESIVGEFRL